MNTQLRQATNCTNRTRMRESRTARFNLPVRHPPLWRFLLQQLVSPVLRLHRLRNLSTRMIEDAMNDLDQDHCR